MENFYDLLKINSKVNRDEIFIAYRDSMKKYINLNCLDSEQINNIKSLKSALYVLSNDDLRIKYDNLLSKANNIHPANNILDDNLDSLFNVDNSWMKNDKQDGSNNTRKNKGFNNSIGDRIFSLQELNKRPLYPVEYNTKTLNNPVDRNTTKIDKKNTYI
jgi:DnaJ-class molecular chaperone